MANIMLSTEFVGKHPNGERFPLHVRVTAPELRSTGEWSCAIELEGLYEKLVPMRGEDALQSLCLALALAHRLMRDFVRAGGNIQFANGSEEQVPLDAYFGPFGAVISPPAA